MNMLMGQFRMNCGFLRKSVVVGVCASVVLIGAFRTADAQTTSSTAVVTNAADEWAVHIQNVLSSRYPLAKTTPDGTDVTAAGAVLVLKKPNLVMNKLFLNTNTAQKSAPVQNSYANGQLEQLGLLGGLSKLNMFLGSLSGNETLAREFGPGDRFWSIALTVQSERVLMYLMTDPVGGSRFHGVLQVPISRAMTAEQVADVVAEVLGTDPPFEVAAAAQQAAPPPANPPEPSQIADDSEQIRRAAEAGDPDAMFQMGNIVAQTGNDVEAVRWFKSASNRGHVKATNALGFMYEEGRGTLQDHKEAAAWYRKAMMRGNPDAMVNRGILLLKGLGVTANKTQAYIHFSLGAAYATDPALRDEAAKLRDDAAKQLTPAQITAAQAEAKKLTAQIKK